MDILLITIISLGISLSLDKVLAYDIYKKLAIRGYVPDTNINEITAVIYDNSRIDSAIPIYNVLKRIFRYSILNYIIYNRIAILFEEEMIRIMDETERAYFEKKPSSSRAIEIVKKREELDKKIQNMYLTINNKVIEIKYMMENGKLEILNYESDLLNKGYTKEDIEELIFKSWARIYANGFVLKKNKYFKELKRKTHESVSNIKNSDIQDIDVDFNYKELVKLNNYFDNKQDDVPLNEYFNLPKMDFIDLDTYPIDKIKRKKM